jgi:hypothetical protein
MKHLVALMLLSSAVGCAEHKLSECFKVRSMTKMDSEHYWASWTNTCPYTIDSVYVMIEFADRLKNPVGNGVWGLHFIQPGAHRVIRFTAPATSSEYHTIHVRKITADSEEALHDPADPPRLKHTLGIGDPGPTVVSPPPTHAATPRAEH